MQPSAKAPSFRRKGFAGETPVGFSFSQLQGESTMRLQSLAVCLAVAVAWAVATTPGLAGDPSAKTKEALHLTADQKEFIWLEPILVNVRVDSDRTTGLPSILGSSKQGTLSLKVDPPLKARPGAKPLPLESQGAAIDASCRHYDLFEWFLFPEKGGTWKVQAVFEQKGSTLTSDTITVTVRKPDKKDGEADPVARIHHVPWSNYDTNAFCGDTFDLVQKWPKSRLAKYCHYWNGRYQQNKKEYAKAIASYRIAADKYPGFALAEDAAYGIVECLYAQKKLTEAKKAIVALRQHLNDQAVKASTRSSPGQRVVQGLAHAMAERIDRDLGLK
jgi:hypothetical protein